MRSFLRQPLNALLAALASLRRFYTASDEGPVQDIPKRSFIPTNSTDQRKQSGAFDIGGAGELDLGGRFLRVDPPVVFYAPLRDLACCFFGCHLRLGVEARFCLWLVVPSTGDAPSGYSTYPPKLTWL